MPRLSWNSPKVAKAEEGVADDQQRPALADDRQGAGDRALLSFVVALEHATKVAGESFISATRSATLAVISFVTQLIERGDRQMSANAVSPITTYFRVCERGASEIRRQQGGLGRHRVAAGAVARKPLGLPSHLEPRRGSRAGGRHRHAGLRPFRRTPGTDCPGRLGVFLARLIDEWGLGAPTSSARTSARPRRFFLPRGPRSALQA